MASKKIQLVHIPSTKNIKRYFLTGSFLIIVSAFMIYQESQKPKGLQLDTFPGYWPYLTFILAAFLLFGKSFFIKRKADKHFICFMGRTFSFRNKNEESKLVDIADVHKIEIGKISATIYLSDKKMHILKFGEATEENQKIIKNELSLIPPH